MEYVSSDESSADGSVDSGDELPVSTVIKAPVEGKNNNKQLSLVDTQQSVLLLTQRNYAAGVMEQNEEDDQGDAESDCSKIVSSVQNVKVDLEGVDKLKKIKRKRKRLLYINLTSCKYESVRRASRRFGFKEVGDDEDWNLYWTDFSVSLERVMDMKRYQKINHFPGMSELCRKDLLARNMNRMLKLFPKEYNVFPRSWCLPADHGDFLAYTRRKKNKTYILKPESGCQGRGIWLTKTPTEVKPHEHMLCQQYLSKPFLIDGYKFDLRIYVVVTSCDPLRIFVFKEGLGRFATNKYTAPSHANVGNVYMHLTNYAINKHSGEFNRDDEDGSKRRISTIMSWLTEHGYDVDKLWRDIDDVLIKTIISAHTVLKHNYRTCFPNHIRGSACFEILGFDIVLDHKLTPFVLEVNHSPSFTTDADIDREIKDTLIYETLDLVNFGAVDRRRCIEEERRKIKERLFAKQDKKELKEDMDKAVTKWLEEQTAYEDTHIGNFRRIYPAEGTEIYDKYFHSSGSLYQETAAFKARSECSRQQREELTRKQEKLDGAAGKRRDVGGLRPESPAAVRSRARMRPVVRKATLKQDVMSTESCTSLSRPASAWQTSNPQAIIESEELDRISDLVQRTNLVRSLGVFDMVHYMLNGGTAPTNGEIKNGQLASSDLPEALARYGGMSSITADTLYNYQNATYHSKQTDNKLYNISDSSQNMLQYNHLGSTSTTTVSGQTAPVSGASMQSYLSHRNHDKFIITRGGVGVGGGLNGKKGADVARYSSGGENLTSHQRNILQPNSSFKQVPQANHSVLKQRRSSKQYHVSRITNGHQFNENLARLSPPSTVAFPDLTYQQSMQPSSQQLLHRAAPVETVWSNVGLQNINFQSRSNYSTDGQKTNCLSLVCAPVSFAQRPEVFSANSVFRMTNVPMNISPAQVLRGPTTRNIKMDLIGPRNDYLGIRQLPR